MKNIPSITIEIEDYAHISKMNNHSIVHIFLNYERNQRRNSLPDNTTYNSYIVRHYPNRIVVCLIREAEPIYHVILVPASQY